MKVCIICKEEKCKSLFDANKRDRCTERHKKVIAEEAAEKERAKAARIKAYQTGDMPKAKQRKPYYNNGSRRKIEQILEERRLAKEWG